MKKASFFIMTTERNKGKVTKDAVSKDGYIDTIKGIQIGFYAKRDEKEKPYEWVATELTTGFAIGIGKTRKAALEFVEDRLEVLKGKLGDPGLDKYREVIRKAKASEALSEYSDKVTKEANAVWKRIVGDKKEITPEDVIKIRQESPEDALIVIGDYMYDGNVTPDEAADWYNGNDKYCKANAKLDKLPEFTELPTKAKPPKVTEECYAKKPEPVKAEEPVKTKAKGKFDLYAEVTNRIISQLEQGEIPWKKPWTGGINGAFNRVSKKPYSILNQCLLKHTGEYASFKQWTELGGKIRKGEKSEMVVFWKIYRKEKEDENGEKKVTTIPLLRYLKVFHISQVDGVEPLKEGLKATEAIPEADVVIADYVNREGITFKEVYEDKAFYRPSTDYVQVPRKDQFNGNANEYYSTAFHELVHSTGHPKRLNRITQVAAFGDEDYSKEELVAEIGSAGIMNYLGLETGKTFKNSAAYIQSWIKALKDDTHMIVNASSKADKAMNLILDK